MFVDIQGLRCVAVVAVVLFHMWPKNFASGFLGVDVFFVISGFLMHHILSSKALTTHTALQFYHRRISRIVPAYLFTILMTALATLFVYTPTEFKKILTELLAASTFSSNIFGLTKVDYFNTNAQYRPFLHTWSLSAELQFYILVPLLFAAYQLIKRANRNAGVLFLCLIMVASFVFQSILASDPNLIHMHVLSRIWQFLIGFVVNIARPMTPDSIKHLHTDLKPTPTRGSKYCLNRKNLLALFLAMQLLTKMTSLLWLDRLICTLTTGLFIFLKGSCIFECSPMVFIGDISYSIYLLHWPMITIYKLVYVKLAETPTVSDGFMLIQVCIFLSVFFEDFFKKLASHCSSFRRLATACLALYLGLAIASILLIRSAQTIPKIRVENSNAEKILLSALEVFETRHNVNLTRQQIFEFNQKIHDFSLLFYNKNHLFNRTSTKPSKIYHQIEGSGNLEIVLIGNSLAGDLYFGMWAKMRNRFKRLTLYFSAGILPFRADEEGDHSADFLDFLSNFDRPIDLLIVRNAHNRVRYEQSYVQNKMTKDMNLFYSNLNTLGPKNIVLGMAEYESFFHYQQFQQTYLKNGDFSDLNYSLKQGSFNKARYVRFHGTWSYPRSRCVYSMEFMERERERDVPSVNCFPSCFSPMIENVRWRDPEAESMNHDTVTFSEVLSHTLISVVVVVVE
ncbi:unnamed protein product [Bursaphelenchus xylophilus]|uniref:(pine wood nematode) hypothetical protein n=1 Tax=Bursaphelenchus xylophilus TaxID=6326 RepID=A0A1I7RQD0_BURXY|nr:unnamed protein product [Bursaphelenchus xylophilus]CAG9104384.1 unnamed protein product [Bursaphelenchus xylophilus]